MYPKSEYAVKPELVFNQDDFTDLLEDSFKKGSVRVTKASKEILKKQNQGVKTLSNSAADAVNELLSHPPAVSKFETKSNTHSSGSQISSLQDFHEVHPITFPTPSRSAAPGHKSMRSLSGKLQTPVSGSSMSTISHGSGSHPLCKIDRVERDAFHYPIITNPSGPNYPPTCRSLQRRGIKVGVISKYPGTWITAICTITERTVSGYHLYQIHPKVWMCVRGIKVNELSLAMEKEQSAYLPAMVEARENLISEYIHAQNQLCILKHIRGEPADDWIKLTRETVDLTKFRMLKTMDGCGSELSAIIALIQEQNANIGEFLDSMEDAGVDLVDDIINEDENEDEDSDDITANTELPEEDEDMFFASFAPRLASALPAQCTVLKHAKQGTSFSQVHDAANCHKNFKALNKDDLKAIREGIDEGIVPSYMTLVDEILMLHKIEPKSRRTFFKFFANLVRNLDLSFSHKIMGPGYVRSAQHFNLRAFLEHWPAFGTLQEHDFIFIENRFKDLVDIAICQGTIHPEFSESIMGNFIYAKHMEGLSEMAMQLLVAEEARKPVSERPVNSFGATILTNEGHKEFMRQRVLSRIEAERNKLDAAAVANAAAAIARIEVEAKKAATALKRTSAAIQLRTNAFEVFDAYMMDIANTVGNTAAGNIPVILMIEQAENTNALRSAYIDAAYRYFVKPNIPQGTVLFTKKLDKLNSVLSWFNDLGHREELLLQQTALQEDLPDDEPLNLGDHDFEAEESEIENRTDQLIAINQTI